MECDVLVVGAGPSGSLAAKTIAESGLNVILIERNKKIGTPVRCAEGISAYLFKDTGIKKHNSFLCRKIKGTKIYFYNEQYILSGKTWQGYVIDRKIFDPYLAKLAQKAGAKVFSNANAVEMKRVKNGWIVGVNFGKIKKQIEAKFVIGADGVESKIGKWAGLEDNSNRGLFKCLEYEMDDLNIGKNDKFHICFGQEFPGGYAWVFPKSKTRANVGVGVNVKKNANLKQLLDFFINKYPNINKMIGGNYKILETRGGLIPANGPKKIDGLVGDNILLVGDAGEFVEPITAEGIEPAMLSGIAAGETIIEAFRKKDLRKNFLKIYEQKYKKKHYSNVKLDELNKIKIYSNLFFYIFNKKYIPKRIRKLSLNFLFNSIK
ncbi:MAG: NAD(P)/FAD-dependent oxidoreductase [Candidatus Aenigmarchaeota archaeon]|nr:NAD(P)/FAD-dependent oxidoreductase [Candidatus Aenigmarchaeota archaeon]